LAVPVKPHAFTLIVFLLRKVRFFSSFDLRILGITINTCAANAGRAMLQTHKERAMQLGDTIATYDVALALRGETGKFDVISPNGETYHMTCGPNHSITKMEWSGNGAEPQPFIIRKVAEPFVANPRKYVAEIIEKTCAAKAPFLIDSSEEQNPGAHNLPVVVAKNMDSGLESRRMEDFDLLFLENDPETKQTTACVCLKDRPEHQPEMLMTALCSNFNELDAEIRRLHAQLDDIRYRARKKFYQAQNVAASA
jgi:hypothetical protein